MDQSQEWTSDEIKRLAKALRRMVYWDKYNGEWCCAVHGDEPVYDEVCMVAEAYLSKEDFSKLKSTDSQES